MLGFAPLAQNPISAQRDPALSSGTFAAAATMTGAPQMPLLGSGSMTGSAALLGSPSNARLDALLTARARRVYAVEISVWALTDRVAA